MKVLSPGHRYALRNIDGDGEQVLQFLSRPPLHQACEGVTNQEVLRALIDRVFMLHQEIPWPGNIEILLHLRMALTLHECRAMLRHVESGALLPERVPVGDDGHFSLPTPSITPESKNV